MPRLAQLECGPTHHQQKRRLDRRRRVLSTGIGKHPLFPHQFRTTAKLAMSTVQSSHVGQVLFASVAAVLVTRYSTHAKQSGIPEIKTVLGGFVIRRFMGVWTLVIKSLGLVGDSLSRTSSVSYHLTHHSAWQSPPVSFWAKKAPLSM